MALDFLWNQSGTVFLKGVFQTLKAMARLSSKLRLHGPLFPNGQRAQHECFQCAFNTIAREVNRCGISFALEKKVGRILPLQRHPPEASDKRIGYHQSILSKATGVWPHELIPFQPSSSKTKRWRSSPVSDRPLLRRPARAASRAPAPPLWPDRRSASAARQPRRRPGR
jgi:hypothetical protein